MIHHHPDDALLLAYASGAADEAISLILATHMTYCSRCRLRSGELEAIGGALLEDITPAPLAVGARDAVMAMLDEVKPYERAPHTGRTDDRTPAVLRPYI